MENPIDIPLYKVPIDLMVAVATVKINALVHSNQEAKKIFPIVAQQQIKEDHSENFILLRFATNYEKNSDDQVNNYLCFIKNAEDLFLNKNDVAMFHTALMRIKLNTQTVEEFTEFLADNEIIPSDADTKKLFCETISSKIVIEDNREIEKFKTCFSKIITWIEKYEQDFDKLPQFLKEMIKRLYENISKNEFVYPNNAKGIINYLNENIESIKSISKVAYAELKSILDSFEQDLSQPARTTKPKEPERD